MAVQAQLYLSGSSDFIDNNGRGVGVGAGAGFNPYGLSVQQLSALQQQRQQQFQCLQNLQERNQNLGTMMFSQNTMVSRVEKERNEIDQLIKSENERLRLVLQQQRKQQFAALVKKVESWACALLGQKDEEIAKAMSQTMELQNLLKRLEMENQAWQRVAHENEAVVSSLNNRLVRLREQASSRFNNGVDDAESCCECEGEEERTMVCKCCYVRRSCVVFLPCRHLCSCKDCAVFLDSCPVCRTAKKGSIEALVS
ncbi:hypothetical protein V6N13_090069 [Hibiscus sabdariffa]|uniref:RING-type domain-containing protein n=1 Tax=Hibiscus sabdariffa TaxID=183260 RepID=A0ABR2QI46_9ROSI